MDTTNDGWTTVSGPKTRLRAGASATSPLEDKQTNNAHKTTNNHATEKHGHTDKSGNTTAAVTRRETNKQAVSEGASARRSASGRRSAFRRRARLTRPTPRPRSKSPVSRKGGQQGSGSGEDHSRGSRSGHQKKNARTRKLAKAKQESDAVCSTTTHKHRNISGRPSSTLETSSHRNTDRTNNNAVTGCEKKAEHDVVHRRDSTKNADLGAGNDEYDEDHDGVSSAESEVGEEPPPESFDAPVMVFCPFQGCTEGDTASKMTPFTKPRPLVSHLESVHGLYIRNLHHMYFSLQRYLDHYAQQMSLAKDGKPVSNGIKVETKDGRLIWTIDPDLCEDDMAFRRALQREKLNEILKIQEKERREDGKVPRRCLFCKVVAENRAVLFRHMFQEHGFNIGLPDNLVEVDEFLGILETKLANRQCLYCEKTFTTPAVLRKHMRKKKHFKISARNRIYDKYYVINYLEPGLNWETLEYEKYESDEDRHGDDDWGDWDEAENVTTQCLFDNFVADTPEAVVEHMNEEHGFDLNAIRATYKLDFYKMVTLINYIRECSTQCICMGCAGKFENLEAMAAHMKENNCFAKLPSIDSDIWKNPKYLFPTIENDPLLMWIDDEDDEVDSDNHHNQKDKKTDDIETGLGVKTGPTQHAAMVAGSETSINHASTVQTAIGTTFKHHSSTTTDVDAQEKKQATISMTVTRSQKYSHVEGVIAEKIDLNDLPDLSGI